jgi:hypothetical protein
MGMHRGTVRVRPLALVTGMVGLGPGKVMMRVTPLAQGRVKERVRARGSCCRLVFV